MHRTQSDFDINALFSFKDVSPKTQQHLRKVYTLLTFMTLFCATGAYLNASFVIAQNFLFHILSIGFSIYLMCYVSNIYKPEENRKYALALLAFQLGFNIGPALHQIAQFQPEILIKAVGFTATAFISFTCMALFSKRRSLLFLGGIGMTMFQGMMFYRFFGFLTGMGGQGLVYLMIMLFVDCCFLIYHTQMIIEKSERNMADVPTDTMNLFLELFKLFVRILRILLELSDKKDKKKR